MDADIVKHLSKLGVVEENRSITFGVDSGAAATVIPSGRFADYPLEDNELSKIGQGYRSADGGFVPDQGTRRLLGTIQGRKGAIVKGISAHVAPVSKALMSVSDMVKAGHVVQFGPHRSFCKHMGTGDEIDFVHKNGVYELTMEVKDYAAAASAFGRQAGRP